MDTKQIRELIETNQVHKFYKSLVWKKKRLRILKLQNYECQRCKAKGKYKKATIIHHIKYLKKHPESALSDNNLEAVCEECHYKEHHKDNAKKFINRERW